MGISDLTNAGFTSSDITITVGGLACSSVSGAISSLTCTMSTNTDSTAILVAGDVTPLVHINNYGIVGLQNGVSALSVSLVATSLSVVEGGRNGGYLIKLTGKGFPTDKSKISLTLCNKNATIKTITNIEAYFYVPSCDTNGASTLVITVGSLSDNSLSFTYKDPTSAPVITTLLPASANPGIKGTIEISGSGYGTDTSKINVFLSNATGKIYNLNILSLNDTSIKAGLPGGREGAFTV